MNSFEEVFLMKPRLQNWLQANKRSREADERRDEKNNKGELKRVLKMASEQMRRWRL